MFDASMGQIVYAMAETFQRWMVRHDFRLASSIWGVGSLNWCGFVARDLCIRDMGFREATVTL